MREVRHRTRGFLVGRFQPLHLGHIELIKSVLKIPALHELIIAIANVEQEQTLSNPFTFAERAWMVRTTLSDLIPTMGTEISVVPLPYVYPPDRFVPSILDQFGPIDLLISNNDWVRAQFQNISGIRLHPKIFFHRDQFRGGKIRELMAKGDDSWKFVVPALVVKYLSERVKQIFHHVTNSPKNRATQPLAYPIISNPFLGEVISGMGVGGRYVEKSHFFQALAKFLGADPFLGTLNVRLQEDLTGFFEFLRSHKPSRIAPKYEGNVSFWNVDCYPAILQANRDDGKKSYVLVLDFGSQKPGEVVVELVAHPHLRKTLGLKDGDMVTIRIL